MRRFGSERGAAPLDAVFGIVTLLFMTLAILQIALALYARNVVAASAHEGARAAIERGSDPSDAGAIARETVRRATGDLVTDLEVRTSIAGSSTDRSISVLVSGRLSAFGPVTVPIRFSSTSTMSYRPGP